MTVGELIKRLKEYPDDLEVIDYTNDVIDNVKVTPFMQYNLKRNVDAYTLHAEYEKAVKIF